MKNIQIHISGEVYKTGFRYFLKQMAEQLSISGFVKYTPDHSLEVHATGNEKALEKFVSFCRMGCFGSSVKKITISETGSPIPDNFEIINNTGTKT